MSRSRAEVLAAIQEIKDLLIDNEFNLATKRVMDFATEFGVNPKAEIESTDLRRRFNKLRAERRLPSNQDFGKIESKLNRDIQDFINSIAEKYSVEEELLEDERINASEEELSEIDNLEPENLATLEQDDILTTSESDSNLTPLEKAEIEHKKQRSKNEQSVKTQSPNIIFKGTNIHKRYKGRSIDFSLDIPGLEIKFGEITSLVGENGNGKTTLLRIIAGNLECTSGKLEYPELWQRGTSDWYRIKKNIAYIPQELEPWTGLLIDNLHFAAAIHGVKGKDNKDRVEFIISRLGLDDYKNLTWNEISGGFKMRFALAKALVWHPKLIILDEPLANLDINTQLIFLQDLRHLANSQVNPKAIILSSQHLYEVEKITDNIIFIQDGQPLYNDKLKVFGDDMENHAFEFSCKLSKDDLTTLLESIDYISIEAVGEYQYIVEAKDNITSKVMLSRLLEEEISLTYFRDISHSTRRLFKIEK